MNITNMRVRRGMLLSANNSYFLTLCNLSSGVTGAIIQMFRSPGTPDRVITSVTPRAISSTRAIRASCIGAYYQGHTLARRLLETKGLEFSTINVYLRRNITIGGRGHALIQGFRDALNDQTTFLFNSSYPNWDMQRYLSSGRLPFPEEIQRLQVQFNE